MNIKALTSYICAGIMTVSCHTPSGQEKAMHMAQKYLTKSELIDAQKEIEKMYKSGIRDQINVQNKIYYWDSLLCINKEKEGYKAGVKMVQDSAAGHDYVKPIYFVTSKKADACKIYPEELCGMDKVAKYYNSEELALLKKDEPESKLTFFSKPHNEATEYIGMLSANGAYRKGFKEGASDARKALDVNM